jgi:hypothetical protein
VSYFDDEFANLFSDVQGTEKKSVFPSQNSTYSKLQKACESGIFLKKWYLLCVSLMFLMARGGW